MQPNVSGEEGTGARYTRQSVVWHHKVGLFPSQPTDFTVDRSVKIDPKHAIWGQFGISLYAVRRVIHGHSDKMKRSSDLKTGNLENWIGSSP